MDFIAAIILIEAEIEALPLPSCFSVWLLSPLDMTSVVSRLLLGSGLGNVFNIKQIIGSYWYFPFQFRTIGFSFNFIFYWCLISPTPRIPVLNSACNLLSLQYKIQVFLTLFSCSA